MITTKASPPSKNGAPLPSRAPRRFQAERNHRENRGKDQAANSRNTFPGNPLASILIGPLSSARRRPFTQTPCTPRASVRSEEHTSELQSLMRISYAVFCLKQKKHRKKLEIQQQQQ